MNPTKMKPRPHVDGMIDSMKNATVNQVMNAMR